MPVVDLPPSGAALMHSLRGVGYNLATALADIIDNAISAEARTITVIPSWHDGMPRIEILDDGLGMDRDTLILKAMKLGGTGPHSARSASDLGRFGLGLKTAAFSQGLRLTVISKCGGRQSSAEWNLERIQRTDRWELFEDPDTYQSQLLDELTASSAGTLVRIDAIDRYGSDSEAARDAFYEALEAARGHASRVFHRFINRDGLSIHFGSRTRSSRLSGNEPFAKDLTPTRLCPEAVFGDAESGFSVTGYVLPPEAFADEKLSSRYGGGKGFVEGQGFYVYRGDRLLTTGGWLGLGNSAPWSMDQDTCLCRIAVEISTGVDSDWSIDIKKASARPPAHLREVLKRYAEPLRDEARRKFNAKFTPLLRPAQSGEELLWLRTPYERPAYVINRAHPLVRAVGQTPALSKLITELERGYPQAILPTDEEYFDRGPYEQA